MRVKNLQYHNNIPFDEYLALPGHSYSSIKGFQGAPNTGMQLGTRVHQYLNEPAHYDWENAEHVRKIAGAIRTFLGDSFLHLNKEVAFTCDLIHNGMILKYKGRADALAPGRLVVDYKVLSGTLAAAVKHFNYDRQISGYCIATGASRGLIISYNKYTNRTEHTMIQPCQKWWDYQIVRLGEPM